MKQLTLGDLRLPGTKQESPLTSDYWSRKDSLKRTLVRVSQESTGAPLASVRQVIYGQDGSTYGLFISGQPGFEWLEILPVQLVASPVVLMLGSESGSYYTLQVDQYGILNIVNAGPGPLVPIYVQSDSGIRYTVTVAGAAGFEYLSFSQI